MALGPKFLQAREQRKRKKVMAERSSSSQQEGALQRKAEASKQGRGGWEAGLVAGRGGGSGFPLPPGPASQPASQPLLREPPRPLQAPAKAALRLCFFNPWGLLTQISIAGQGSIGKTLEVGT